MNRRDIRKIRSSLGKFHSYFAPFFGRKQWRERSSDYLKSLVSPITGRRNAENLSEVGERSARAFQRFLTDAKWKCDLVIARLQKYLRPILSHKDAVWAVDDTGIVKKGKKSAGVTRQYTGTVGGVANCQVGVFLGYNSLRGRAIIDKRLYLPEQWAEDKERCLAAGISEEKCRYRTKAELALEMLSNAKELGYLNAKWVTADDWYGRVVDFRDGVAKLGLWYLVDVPSNTQVWPQEVSWVVPPRAGKRGRLPNTPRPAKEEQKSMQERATALPQEAWQEIKIGEGAQGPRIHLFACERLRDTRDGKPGEIVWAIYRKNLDGSDPGYSISNAPEDTPPQKLATIDGMRWPIETEFQMEKSYIGLDEYEVRSFHGWHHHITMCLLVGAFLLKLQQEWGEKYAPDHTPAGILDSIQGILQQPV